MLHRTREQRFDGSDPGQLLTILLARSLVGRNLQHPGPPNPFDTLIAEHLSLAPKELSNLTISVEPMLMSKFDSWRSGKSEISVLRRPVLIGARFCPAAIVDLRRH